MNAPDVIYVASYNGEAFSHSWTMEPLGDTTATKYIRKDALLEWAETRQECQNLHLEYDAGVYDCLQCLIDKLDSM